MHRIQNRRDNVFIADRCVNHHVIQTAGRPVGVEVMFHKDDAILVDRVHQFFGCALAPADFSQTSELLRARRIQKDVKRIRPLAEKIWRAPAHDDAISRSRSVFHDLLPDRHKAIGVKNVGAGKRHVSLVASPPEHFGKAVKSAVHALVTTRYCRGIDPGNLGDLFGQLMIPKFPAEPLGQLLGNLSAAASEFTLDCDDAIHNPPLVHGNFSTWPGPLNQEDQEYTYKTSSTEEPN